MLDVDGFLSFNVDLDDLFDFKDEEINYVEVPKTVFTEEEEEEEEDDDDGKEEVEETLPNPSDTSHGVVWLLALIFCRILFLSLWPTPTDWQA